MFVVGTFVPLIPQIAKDMQSTAAVVRCLKFRWLQQIVLKFSFSWAVSISVFAISIGSLLASSYSSFCTYFRSILLAFSYPAHRWKEAVLFIACLGVASAQSIPQLLFWRFVQAMGASPGLTIGTAVIGDIYKLEERGTAFGLFFAVSYLTPNHSLFFMLFD